MSVLGRSCWTNNEAPAPNPSPERWEIQQIWAYDNAYVLKVKYLDCTNYEGMKVMVYKGQYIHSTYLECYGVNATGAAFDNIMVNDTILPTATPTPTTSAPPEIPYLLIAVGVGVAVLVIIAIVCLRRR